MNTSAALRILSRTPQSDRSATPTRSSEDFNEQTGVRQRNDVSLETFARLSTSTPGLEPHPSEVDRVRLIGDLSRLLHQPDVPEATRAAGLTLIGWLARRMPGEAPHSLGVPQPWSPARAKDGANKKRR